jgi:ketosteroid isomerase-like protein
MKYTLMICVAFSAVSLSACTQSSVDTAAEQAALRSAADAYHEAAHRGDFGSMVDFYANDGFIVPPNAAEEEGLQGARNFFAAIAEIPGLRLRFVDVRVEVAASGDMGYTLADIEISFEGPDGEPVEDKERDFHLWKKQDGKWKIAVDIWNSELPLPGAAAAATSLEGAWVVTSLQSSDGAAIDPAGPGQFIFLDGRYSAVYTVGVTERRKSVEAFDPTEEEMVEQYDTIIVNSGTYQVEGNELTLRPLVAKSPEFIGGSSTMEFSVNGDTLTTKIRQLTSANGISPEGAIGSTMTLRRVP